MKNVSKEKRVLTSIFCLACTQGAIFLPEPVNATPALSDPYSLLFRSDTLLGDHEELIDLVTLPESKNKKQSLYPYQLPQRVDNFAVYPLAIDEQPGTSGMEFEEHGATASGLDSYRLFLFGQIEHIISTDIEFFMQRIPPHSDSYEDTVRHFFRSRETNLIEEVLSSYLANLSSDQQAQWLRSLLQSPPEECYRFFIALLEHPTLPGNLLPDLPEEATALLWDLDEHDLFRLRMALTLPDNLGRDNSTQSDDYFSILSSGKLPGTQPPQRSVVLSLSDFRNQENFTRLNENERLSGTLQMANPTMQNRHRTPEDDYRGYLLFIINSSRKSYETLIVDLQSMFIGVLGFSHPLREEHGLFYTPSSLWLNPLVSQLREHVDGTPVGLEVGAGRGSLSHFLYQNYRISMTATDTFITYRSVTERTGIPLQFPVTRTNALDAVQAHNEANFLVLSWPGAGYIETECEWDFVRSSQQPDTEKRMGKGLLNRVSSPSDESNMYLKYESFFPFWAAVIAWNNRGPILFIGEPWNERNSFTAGILLRKYLANHFHAISFKNHYQSPPFASEYPVLYIPKKAPK